MSFICMGMKNHFHINGLALSLALKRLGAKMAYLAVTGLRGVGGGGGGGTRGKVG